MDIRQSPAGKVIKTSTGYEAYLPNPLPPPIDWDNKLVNSLSRADYVLGQLAREGARLPNPHLLMRPFITREAVLSSKIEGTHATIGEVLAYNAGATSVKDSADLQEVENYIVALDLGLKRLKQIPLSLRLIREIHQQVNARGTRSERNAWRIQKKSKLDRAGRMHVTNH